jgi:hypothetical protein
MNIIAQRQSQRNEKISTMQKSISACFNKGLTVDKEKLILTSCNELNISRRTALEYLATISFKLGFIEKKINDRKHLIFEEDIHKSEIEKEFQTALNGI